MTIQPFRIEIPEAELEELHERIAATRWPDELPGAGPAYGAPLTEVKELAEYWLTGYDWRVQERRLNELPQFTAEIDGQRVHFVHLRSPRPDALPLIITHGWPGSPVEFLDILGPLSDPASYGGDPADAFHLVVPSLPGYGLSGPTREPGWDTRRIARAWAELMKGLGYERYGAQGGDWGSAVSHELAVADPDHLIGVHVNTLTAFPAGDPSELERLTPRQKEYLERSRRFMATGLGYGAIQGSRPQTLAYALTDSPVGQLAWIAEKFGEWTEAAVDRDALLTNVMLYWLTRTANSSARLYYEVTHSGRAWGQTDPSTVPMGVAVFPRDIAPPVRPFAERSYRNIVHWSEFERGGHFAAMEVPELLVSDVRIFFRQFRRQASHLDRRGARRDDA